MTNDDRPRREVSAADTKRLVPLGRLDDARLAPDEPDVRGWGLLGAGSQRFGVVDDLLVDTARNEVGALMVRTGDELAIVPITAVTIRVRERVVMTDLTRRELDTLPRATSSRGDARPGAGASRRVVDAPASREAHPGVTVERTADGGEVVQVPIVEEQLVVERRPVVKEIVVIRKRPVTEEGMVEADLKRERIAVDGPVTPDERR